MAILGTLNLNIGHLINHSNEHAALLARLLAIGNHILTDYFRS